MAQFPENGPASKLMELFLLIEGLKIISLQTARNMHAMSRPKMIDRSMIWSAAGNTHTKRPKQLTENSPRMN